MKAFKWGRRTYIMGILNVTPNSFSGDGILDQSDRIRFAVARAKQFAADGADIIDIGGESTRPGSSPVSPDEEMARVLPVIKAVRKAIDIPISVDTYRAPVAEAALTAGANWVNDVWGLQLDPDMPAVVAKAGCPVVIMHNRSQPKHVEQQKYLGGRYTDIRYAHLIPEVIRELQVSIDLALSAGIDTSQIIIDPGIGFGKTVEQNLELVNSLHHFKTLGYPILLGTSRKSFIGYTLNIPPEDRLEGTAATVAIGIDRGADVIRVHDIKAMARVAKMTDNLVRGRQGDKETR